MPQLKEFQNVFIESLNHLYHAEEALELYWLSMEHVLEKNRLRLKLDASQPINKHQITAVDHILGELKKGRPIQHILGYSWFLGQKFIVNGSVLIPRPETEELVLWILEDMATVSAISEVFHILDIGTGTGCIPISLKKKAPFRTQVHAIDISPDALQVAKENAIVLKADIDFLQLDILEAEPYVNQLSQKFHVIVSNPPYITPEEQKEMHKNVLDFEPRSALFVEQEDPLIFYHTIASYALKNLHEGGHLYLEINQHYGSELVDYLSKTGFTNIILKKDISGNDRMIRASFT